MDESFPFSILGRGNGESYGLIQLVSDNSECDEQTCLGKEFVPGEWDVVSFQRDGVCLLAPFYFIIVFRACNSLCTGNCFGTHFNRFVEEGKESLTMSEIVVFGS
jgi:hypothetical protein